MTAYRFGRFELLPSSLESGDLAEARAVGRDVIPDLRDLGPLTVPIEHFALFAAKSGQSEAGARLLGWSDSLRSRQDLKAQTNEARARASVLVLLSAVLEPDDLARLFAEGAALEDVAGYELLGQACRDVV